LPILMNDIYFYWFSPVWAIIVLLVLFITIIFIYIITFKIMKKNKKSELVQKFIRMLAIQVVQNILQNYE